MRLDLTKFPIDSLKVGYRFYDVTFIDSAIPFVRESNLHGYVDPASKAINIATSENGLDNLNTLTHEILHALHIDKGLYDGDTEEKFTEMTTNALFAFWLDNPSFKIWFDEQFKILSEDIMFARLGDRYDEPAPD
jgi:hypothetical protein